MIAYFLFFFLSGLSSLIYQVIWLRVAMANFGVTTPLVSIVLSVFMAGLALGSWAGGRLTQRFQDRSAASFLRWYRLTELAIGLSGLVVPLFLRAGRTLIEADSSSASWGSFAHYLISAGWIVLVMLPFCACMGATIPLAMAGIRAAFPNQASRSFSYLYLANVLGAAAGTLGSAFVLIELLGFTRTLYVAASVNAILAAGAFGVASMRRMAASYAPPLPAPKKKPAAVDPGPADARILPWLFITGLCSLGMEVVWTRQFTPFLGPMVYSFAAMLAVYLAGTAAGSQLYRVWAKTRATDSADATWGNAVIVAAWCALFPLLGADPRGQFGEGIMAALVRVAFSIGPFCCALGFLTPLLVDRWSRGNPDRAARAYAVNAIGCIIGPVAAGFLLLPAMGERMALLVLATPFLIFPFLPSREAKTTGGSRGAWIWGAGLAVVAAGVAIAYTRDYATQFPDALVRRDSTATVIAEGRGMNKHLLVNGVGMTSLTPITKMMVHLPAAMLPAPPRKILILCFGMGTSFRSALSWGASVTVVDLVPSVPRLMGFFHADGERLLRSPNATIVIDDARRFLERTTEKFDLIVIDPPPPVEAAASSLLYSREFYQVAARHLSPGGILQQWLPYGDVSTGSAMTQALAREFPERRAYRSVEGWGLHFLLSTAPISGGTGAGLAGRLPREVAADLVEWGPQRTAEAQFQTVLEREVPFDTLIKADPQSPMLTDDHPLNEYFLLRLLLRSPKEIDGIFGQRGQ